MSIFADCDICGTPGPCELVDGQFLCDDCYFDYQTDLEESDPDYYCDGDCIDCDDWENCESYYQLHITTITSYSDDIAK